MTEPGKNSQLAGFVLAVVGLFTYGSTGPFAFVLCLEWVCNPDRPRNLKRLDWVGLVLSVPESLFFAYLSIGLFTYAPGGNSFAPMIVAYWGSFTGWVLWRFRQRSAAV
jgi:hypothetical protein